MKIIVAGIHGLTADQANRLKSLGDATFFAEAPKTKEEKLAQLSGFIDWQVENKNLSRGQTLNGFSDAQAKIKQVLF